MCRLVWAIGALDSPDFANANVRGHVTFIALMMLQVNDQAQLPEQPRLATDLLCLLARPISDLE
jgi:hypothetical protein